MKIKKENTTRYLIDDFLEIKTGLSERERSCLLDKIEAECIQSDCLKSQPAFWMDDRVLVVLENQPSECWFYYAGSGKLEKVRLKGLDSALKQVIGVIH